MSHRFLETAGLLAVASVLGFLATPVSAQTPASAYLTGDDWTPPVTPWGDPDLQGIYTSDDYIRVGLQRNPELGDRLFLTEEERSQRDNQLKRQAENALEEFADPDARVGTGPPGHWLEQGRRAPEQTSLIIDPPDGRLPELTLEGERRQALGESRLGATEDTPADSWEDYTYYIRCITRGVAGSILPVIYGNGTEIIQAPGYVAILHEMVHEARIIPLDDRPQAGSAIRTYMGDSRGHWEGHTLVVETTNMLPDTTGLSVNGNGTPGSDAMVLTERFTRVDPDTVYYELTVDDPKTYTRSWTVGFPIRQEPGYQLYEYACHEGNHGMMNQLSASRAQDDER